MSELENDIQRYLRGKMTREEEHALEKKALDDPFLAEALEGASLISSDEMMEDLQELRHKIEHKTKKKGWFWPLGIAASLALIVVVYILIKPIATENVNQELASQKPQTEIQQQPTLTPDTLKIAQAPAANYTLTEENRDKETPATNRLKNKTETKTEQIAKVEITEQVTEDDSEAKINTEVADEISTSEQVVSVQPELKKNNQGYTSIANNKIKVDSIITSDNQNYITGKVLSAEDGTPVPGVNIIVKGTTQGAVTDMNGNYKIAVGSAESTLVYSFIGLQTQELNTKDKSEINVNMEPDISQLSEVVVTGYSPYPKDENHEPVIKLASPVGGLRAYDKYLKNSLQYPQQALDNKVKGRVTLMFTVKTDGSLDEFNIVKGLGFGCDEEVIRLVKDGPKWSPTTEDNVAVESEVRVRVKFSLPN